MSRPRIAVVCVASRFEFGGERAPALMSGAVKGLKGAGLDVVEASRTVWGPADAIAVIGEFKAAKPDLLAIIHVTWVLDSLQYLFAHQMACPLLMWAIPYTETFSVGCVQHFGSILKQNGKEYQFCYGLPEEPELIARVAALSRTAKLADEVRNAKIALLGPRQTWRVANSQDMVKEEWDFSRAFGATILHVDMDELLSLSSAHSDKEAEAVLAEFKTGGRLGPSKAGPDRLKAAAKTYLGMKELFARYELSTIAAECYPQFGGLANLPASWLADEGLIVDTEGDIGHSMLLKALYGMGKAGPVALAEIGKVDAAKSIFELAHEGSSAHSLAGDLSRVLIQDGGSGTMIGFSMPAMPRVTLANMVGTGGNYKLALFTGSTEPISHDEWVAGGSKFMARVRVEDAGMTFSTMLDAGIDHHLLIKEGDLVAEIRDFCAMLGIDIVRV